ncbi:DUF6308 family protein [Nocardioides campestrisoli]|uniref:DUF6308 family protein n=1 Tax=Nocardioides campestrisoli TaxID=2736757 RepID=UPI001CD3AC80
MPNYAKRLARLRHDAHLPTEISPLRVFDVVTWMAGKYGLPKPAQPVAEPGRGRAPVL